MANCNYKMVNQKGKTGSSSVVLMSAFKGVPDLKTFRFSILHFQLIPRSTLYLYRKKRA